MSDKKKYAIVEIDDKYFIILSEWIVGQRKAKCQLPKNDEKHVLRALKKETQPDESWITINYVKIHRFTGTK